MMKNNPMIVDPLVSVCIQTYQHKDFIAECIESAIKQKTNFPFEIIIGEDDSTDGTREVCKEYSEKYPHLIKLFLRSEKDKIYVYGQKTGRHNYIENLKTAKGKYIALLDGDDYWTDEQKLQKQADFMEANPGCSLSYHKIFYQDIFKTPEEKPGSFWQDPNIRFTIQAFFEHECFISPVSCMLRKKNIEEMPSWFYEVPILDLPLFLYNALKGDIGFIPETMGVYRSHPGGMWRGQRSPGNTIRYWRMYKTLADNMPEQYREKLLQNRHKKGVRLINFYKEHLWHDTRWLENELRASKVNGDDELLEQLQSRPTIKNYFKNSWNFTKELARRLLKKKH